MDSDWDYADNQNEGKVWLLMDEEIEHGKDTRKRIRLEHEYDNMSVRLSYSYQCAVVVRG